MRTLCTAGQIVSVLVTALIVAGCAREPVRTDHVSDQIIGEMDKGVQRAKPRQSDAVNQALLPPLRMELPQAQGKPIEGRFDLNISNAPAREVFMSIVSGTRYSMLIHPDVSGAISVNLKDVTVSEALDAIREVYGYEYRLDGTRIYIQPAGLQTRVFQVNYLMGLRQGRSDMTVNPGSVSTAGAQPSTGSAGAAAGAPGTLAPSLSPGSVAGGGNAASRVSMSTQSDFWNELRLSVGQIIGTGPGRNVVVSPQSGVVVVTALPGELRNVEKFIKAMSLSVDRQVLLEAKIIDVSLTDNYQAGVNWAAFPTSGLAAGFPNSLSGTTMGISGPLSSGSVLFSADPGARIMSGGAGVFGLAFQARNFAALLQFLETQGTVQVLASPRVSTLNNQKAVLKVGADEYFITKVTTSAVTNSITGNTTILGTPEFNTLFSGISLDITPQIGENDVIALHVHPLISTVENKDILFDFGSGLRNIPMAKSNISETDTMVRVQDGNIVALGGLMRLDMNDSRGAIPGLGDAPGVGGLFRNNQKQVVKRELVVLIKASIIRDDVQEKELLEARERLQHIGDDRIPPRQYK